jgi:hypothetical protein
MDAALPQLVLPELPSGNRGNYCYYMHLSVLAHSVSVRIEFNNEETNFINFSHSYISFI